MYRYIDVLRIIAAGLAAAVVLSLSSQGKEDPAAVRNCLLFPQFSQAAAADRSSPLDDGEIVYSFRIVELFEGLFDRVQ